MKKIYVELKQNEVVNSGSWSAFVKVEHFGKEGQNKVAIDDNVTYSTKQKAWESIKNRVERLSYEENQIYFNNKLISSIEEIEQLKNKL